MTQTTTAIDHREWKEWRDTSPNGAIGKLNEMLMPHGVTLDVCNDPDNDYLELRASSYHPAKPI
jgi:hypothetical protein